jgi:hypothetical protein
MRIIDCIDKKSAAGSGRDRDDYIAIEKEFRGKKLHTTLRLTGQRRATFRQYKKSMQQVLDGLPD